MAYNKATFNGDTVFDLTADTVSENKMLLGTTAHNNLNEAITGDMIPVLSISGQTPDANGNVNGVLTVNSVAPNAQGNVDVVALPTGGTQGQYLVKQSSTDGDADWETRVVELTQAEYDQLTPDPDVTYYITDANVNPTDASNVTYDNSTSGLSASSVQTAIDEVNGKTFGYPNVSGNLWIAGNNIQAFACVSYIPMNTDKYHLALDSASYFNNTTSSWETIPVSAIYYRRTFAEIQLVNNGNSLNTQYGKVVLIRLNNLTVTNA